MNFDPVNSRVHRDLACILVLATVLRLWGAFHDLPTTFDGDEAHWVNQSVAMGTGDLNPHWFDKPAFLSYVLFFCYGTYYLMGRLAGAFTSADDFGAHFLANWGAFLLIGRAVVVGFGIGTVLLIYLIAATAFRSPLHGLVSSYVAAVFFPLITASQVIKADGPAGFFIAFGVFWFLKTRDEARYWPLVLAAISAGVAAGTKYYGVILLPAFCLADAVRCRSTGRPIRILVARSSLVVAVFAAAFFMSSPYHFLDSTWLDARAQHAESFLVAGGDTYYDPETQAYVPAFTEMVDAGLAFFEAALRPEALGLPLAFLMGVGLVWLAWARELRWHALLVWTPIVCFGAIASTFFAFYLDAYRYLNAVYPLLLVVVFPGALILVKLLRVPPGKSILAAMLLVVVAAMPTLVLSVRHDLSLTRTDSRALAYAWVIENLPANARILWDEDGQAPPPNELSITRQEELLRELPTLESFTAHQRRRLDLLKRYPAPNARNVDILAHPWWLSSELSDDELRSSPFHRSMGNPLKSRQPRTVQAYRDAGVRFVVASGGNRSYYMESEDNIKAFPSFVRFYRDLAAMKLVKSFDPATWEGKGPVVEVYDIGVTGPEDLQRRELSPAPVGRELVR